MAKRRQHGEGTIVQRKDGRWAGALSVTRSNGTTGRVWVYGKTVQDVREKLRAKQREIDNGVNLFADNPTVVQYLAAWLEYTVKPAKAKGTHLSYTVNVKHCILPQLGEVKLKSLKADHVRRMVATLQREGYANGTINLALTILKSALKTAVASGEITRNVATGITVRVEKYSITPLTAHQAQRMLETVYGHRNYALYYLALSLGLRQGELLALRWADISMDKRTLTVRKAKSKAGIRTLTLPAHIIDVLQDHWHFQATERVLRGDTWQEHGLVFPNERGKPQAPSNLRDNFKRMLQRAKLPNVRFHDLRHTAATLMIEQGVHLKVVQEVLGHSTLAMTADTYAHVSTNAVEEALDKLRFMK